MRHALHTLKLIGVADDPVLSKNSIGDRKSGVCDESTRLRPAATTRDFGRLQNLSKTLVE